MKVKFICIVLSMFLILSGCSKETLKTKNAATNSTEPKQVVENYYKYKNEKNKQGMLKTLTEGHDRPNVVWGFESLEYIRIVNINEETDPTFKKGYLSNKGSINRVKEENVKVYKVEYEVKYKQGAVVAEENGKHIWWYYLIRKDKDSPWLIDEMGQP